MKEKNFGTEYEVTVVCFVYNHEKYLRQTLEGFAMQKTSFPFVALVHDDCSTDSSAEIIREFEAKYPDIIRGMYETENQYSKGAGAVRKAVTKEIHSKYVALCEGDDYWTDPGKLQKQYDAMERNPDCDICAHGVTTVDESGTKKVGSIRPSESNTLFSVEDVILGGGPFVGTCSLFMKTKVYTEILPFSRNFTLDYTVQISGALNGGMLYLADDMAVYRRFASGSWTDKMRKNPTAWRSHENRMLNMLIELDSYTGYRYHDTIIETIATLFWKQTFEEKTFSEARKTACFRMMPFNKKAKMLLKEKMPWLKRLKDRVKEIK